MRGTAEPADDQLVDLFVRAERMAARIVGRSRAEDIAAETMIRLVAAWPRVSGHAEPWVTRVAVNLAIDELRRRTSAQRLQDERADDATTGFEDAAGDRLDLVALLGKLSRRRRQAVVLHHLVGLDDDDAAQTMGVSVHTARTHLDRGMRALRKPVAPTRKER